MSGFGLDFEADNFCSRQTFRAQLILSCSELPLHHQLGSGAFDHVHRGPRVEVGAWPDLGRFAFVECSSECWSYDRLLLKVLRFLSLTLRFYTLLVRSLYAVMWKSCSYCFCREDTDLSFVSSCELPSFLILSNS